jgi:hypothetical protein
LLLLQPFRGAKGFDEHGDYMGWQQLGFMEGLFWMCVLAWFGEELHQLATDFNWSFSEYLKGSGNGFDMMINLSSFSAMLCRVLATIIAMTSDGDSGPAGRTLEGRQLCTETAACGFFTAMAFLLGFNLLLYLLRLLYSFSVSMRLGVLQIIITRIAADDVGPFLIYLGIVIIGFEIFAQSFSWYLVSLTPLVLPYRVAIVARLSKLFCGSRRSEWTIGMCQVTEDTCLLSRKPSTSCGYQIRWQDRVSTSR